MKSMFKESGKNIKDTFKLAWDIDKRCIISITVHAFCVSMISVMALLLSSYCIEALATAIPYKTIIWNVILVIFAIFMLMLCGSYAEKIKSARIFHTETELNSKVTEKNLDMDYEALDGAEIQEIKNKMAQDRNWGWGIVSFYWYYDELISSVLKIIMSIIIIFPLLCGYGMTGKTYYFILIVLGLILLSIGISVYTCINGERDMRELMENPIPASLSSYIIYDKGLSYNNGKDIRIYEGNKLCKGLFDNEYNFAREYGKRFEKNMGLKSRNLSMIKGLIMCGSYFAVVFAAKSSGLSIANMIKYAGIIYIMCENLSLGVDIFFEFKLTCNRQQSTLDYLNYPNKMHKGSLPVEKMYFCDNGDNDYEIEFRNVSFKYPTSDVYSLKNISFKFKVGQKLAVVGMNGSGKTTMIKLLCRLYDPTEGEILLNGVNIKSYDYKEYMSIFSVVFQDFRLLSFTLGQNISCDCEYDSYKAVEALDKAGFKERFFSMEKGLETCLYNDFDSGNGVEISGGEAQKISLARALYKNSPFIILDEPTAAMDPVAEYDIYSRFNKVVGDKTAIYISHRLSSCIFCDSIVVFHEGCIIQNGSHQELLSDEQGKYYELWNAQAKYYV